MKFTKPTVTLDGDQLQSYLELAWKTCWEVLDKEPADTWRHQDYVTGSDIESCVRWLVDRDYDKVKGQTQFFSKTWQGHDGWCMIRVKDSERGPLLSRCQRFLYRLARDGQAIGHNFGRGHISGARYRRVGSDLISKTEERTMYAKEKEKPLHLEHSDGGPACTAGRRNDRWRYRFNPKGPRTTSVQDKVTCQRCINILRREEEINPMP